MSEYWKSIPKKFCDVCKVWYQDNKISVDHHEKGFKHKANVQKKIQELRKRGQTQAKEESEYKLEMMKIEAAALSSFQKDIVKDPSRAKEFKTTSSLIDSLPEGPMPSSSSQSKRGRFGEDLSGEESMAVIKGREKALETIAKKMERKFRWLERKTAEGEVFFFNRETFESSREKPKDGFIPLSEQDGSEYDSHEASSSEVPSWQSSLPDAYGQWQEVKTKEEVTSESIDLQLPKDDYEEERPSSEPQVSEAKPVKKEVIFTEKTLEKPLSSKTDVGFKKRKFGDNAKKNVRQRTTD